MIIAFINNQIMLFNKFEGMGEKFINDANTIFF